MKRQNMLPCAELINISSSASCLAEGEIVVDTYFWTVGLLSRLCDGEHIEFLIPDATEHVVANDLNVCSVDFDEFFKISVD